MTFDPQPMLILPALIYWAVIVVVFTGLIVSTSLFVLTITSYFNPIKAAKRFFRLFVEYVSDLFSLSIRRIWAIGMLTFKEAYRRKALMVFVVFGLLFMFAGWFMGGDVKEITKDDVKIYVSFVLRSMTWLTALLMLVLSCYGIPEDIRLRSIHTVVTKPARRLEVVLGRILGFSMVGTLVLAVMSVVGYFWIVRQIPATAQNDVLICRAPIYGSLKFMDRNGADAATGINTGDLWEFRSYIEGGTKARAIWTFHGIDESVLDSRGQLHIENQFLAFRTYKGNMNQSLLYDYQFVNPETKATFTTTARSVNENRGVQDVIPRILVRTGDKNKQFDIIKDFVTSQKTLTIEVSCIDREQYLGMARPDLFLRMPDRGFYSGYFKAVLGIELMMVLIVLFAVTASTFLKGPIAMVATMVLFLVSGEDTHAFMDQLLIGRSDIRGFQGGGFLESIYRIIMHLNPGTELPGKGGAAVVIMEFCDNRLLDFLLMCKHLIPQMRFFNMSDYVSNGFDVPWDSSLLPFLMMTIGYMIPCILLGYFALRIRELESK